MHLNNLWIMLSLSYNSCIKRKLLTAKDLFEKVGISPIALRKLLCREFGGLLKIGLKVIGLEYRFDLNLIFKQIIDRVRCQKAENSIQKY